MSKITKAIKTQEDVFVEVQQLSSEASDQELITNQEDDTIKDVETIKEDILIIDELPPHVIVNEPVPVPKKLGKKNGVVSNCNALRMREGANIKTSILNILKAGTIVSVDLDNSTKTFYEITYDGLIGFCLKEFISLE